MHEHVSLRRQTLKRPPAEKPSALKALKELLLSVRLPIREKAMMDEQDNQTPSDASKVEPIWGVAANVVKERPYGPGGKETRQGTRKFHGGAKVYIVGAFWGMGGEEIEVIGHYRGKHPYITSIVGAEYLENYRPELIYSPTIISRLESGPYSTNPIVKLISSREVAEKMADDFNQLSEQYRAEKRAKWQLQQSEETKTDQPEDEPNHS